VEKHSVLRRGRPAGGVTLVLGLTALLAVSSCRSTAPAPLERPGACGFYRCSHNGLELHPVLKVTEVQSASP
jgi:hypothetical protein